MVDFFAGIVVGAIIFGFIAYQIGFVSGRNSMKKDRQKGRQ